MILGTTRVVSVYAFPAPADLRKGYDGLYGLVKSGLQRDPLRSHTATTSRHVSHSSRRSTSGAMEGEVR